MTRDVAARRSAGRRHAARKRAEQWAIRVQATGAIRCPTRAGRFGVCNARLETVLDALGRTVVVCPRCERRRRGICQDCPRRVEGTVGKARRCAMCKRVAIRASCARSVARHRDRIRARARMAAQDPVRRARNIEYKKLWRQAHPEQVRAWKRREALQQSARRLTYAKRYNAGRRAEKAAAMRDQYRAQHPIPTPTCRTCRRPIPWVTERMATGRPPLDCVFCQAARRPSDLQRSVQRWVARDAEAPAAAAASRMRVRPLRPKHRMPAPVAADGRRTCYTCPAILRGRAKRCDACKARAHAVAVAALQERRRSATRRGAAA